MKRTNSTDWKQFIPTEISQLSIIRHTFSFSKKNFSFPPVPCQGTWKERGRGRHFTITSMTYTSNRGLKKIFVSLSRTWCHCSKSHGKRGHIVADTLLPTQMFPRSPARATFVADTNFVSGTQKMFLILFRNILCPQQMFPSLRSTRNIVGNNVSATMCPRLPGP